MNRIVIFSFLYFMYCFLFAQTPTYQNDTNWQLKWEDNFDSLGVQHFRKQNCHLFDDREK